MLLPLFFVAVATGLAPAAAADRQLEPAETISCRTTKGGQFVDCAVRVVRSARGTATVTIEAPSGRRRTIQYKDGAPVSSDAGMKILYERNRDTLIVRVGQVEIYEIPDVLIIDK